jgi:DinB superfamily
MADISTLIETYSGGAKLLSDAIRSTANGDLDTRPIEGKWSVREVVCHLADSEIIYADRMKRVLAEDNPTFFEADPNLFGPALFCPRRPVDKELDVIKAIRAHMLPILQSCDADDFQRTGVHSLDGPMTLRTLLERITAHIPHHVAFIEDKRKAMAGL